MGNRFYTLTGYQSLVKAHGIIAAITFLLVIPAAIFAMRFYGRNPRQAIRSHIWLQITSLLLVTVVFVIGWFQVGPRRSLSNPHHGIGLALFVLVWVQVIGGALARRVQKRRATQHLSLKAMIHHWLGRAVALLGIAQVALGLTLYGSPLFLFILYAFWVFALVLLYFILEWQVERKRARYTTGASGYTEEVVETRPASGNTGFGKLAAAGAAGAGLAALFSRRNKRKRRASESDLTYASSAASSDMYEKPHTTTAHRKPGLGRRILEIGAVGGALAAAKSVFSRKRRGDDYDDTSTVNGPYRPPLGGNHSIMTDSMSRVEEGRPNRPVTPTQPMAAGGMRSSNHPLAQPPMEPGSAVRPHDEEYSYYDYESSSPSRQGRHQTFKQAMAAGGVMYGVRSLFRSRKDRREEGRAEALRQQRIQEERLARMNSQHRYTGDGLGPPRRPRHSRLASQTASDISSVVTNPQQRPVMSSTGVPLAGAGIGAAAATALSNRNRIRPVGADPVISPPGPAGVVHAGPVSGPIPNPSPYTTQAMPPPPPPHDPDMLSSGSELYTTASGRQRHRHHLHNDVAAAGINGTILGAGAIAATDEARRRRASGQNTDSIETPPVSVHLKTHDDGRKVTLRRLTEEEAAAQRAARRAERRGSRRRRNSSLSDSSPGDVLTRPGAGTNWRRAEEIEQAQQAAIDASVPVPVPMHNAAGPRPYPTPPLPGTQGVDPHSGAPYNVPPPPPIPIGSQSNIGGPATSITSPGTETSGATEYANNRRRRRAERAQARLAKEVRAGGGTNTVEFT